MIKPITNYHKNNIQISFKQNKPNYIKNDFVCDSFSFKSDNIQTILKDKNNNLESIVFKEPLSIKETLYRLSTTKNNYIRDEFLRKLHPLDVIKEIADSIEKCKNIKDIKIKSLKGMGFFALAFETEDGKILKITEQQHFPNNRKPADFDVPIYKSGQINKAKPFYYYLEEKLEQKSMSQEELKIFIESIKEKGFILRDYMARFSFDEFDNPNIPIKMEQFGKSAEGKIYLLDPGCVLEPSKPKFNKFKNFSNLISKFFQIKK